MFTYLPRNGASRALISGFRWIMARSNSLTEVFGWMWLPPRVELRRAVRRGAWLHRRQGSSGPRCDLCLSAIWSRQLIRDAMCSHLPLLVRENVKVASRLCSAE